MPGRPFPGKSLREQKKPADGTAGFSCVLSWIESQPLTLTFSARGPFGPCPGV